MSDFIISIKPRYAMAIVSGEKTVEIRRRKSRLKKGDRLWIYSTKPDAKIIAMVSVTEVESNTRQAIWLSYAKFSALTRADYDRYTEGTTMTFAIRLGQVKRLVTPVSLEELRGKGSFHPPQFVCRLNPSDAIYWILEKALGIKKAA